MGMFGEVHAQMEAKKLQGVLIAAIDTGNEDILNFCKEHIYPQYSWALGEAWSDELTSSEEYKKIASHYGS